MNNWGVFGNYIDAVATTVRNSTPSTQIEPGRGARLRARLRDSGWPGAAGLVDRDLHRPGRLRTVRDRAGRGAGSSRNRVRQRAPLIRFERGCTLTPSRAVDHFVNAHAWLAYAVRLLLRQPALPDHAVGAAVHLVPAPRRLRALAFGDHRSSIASLVVFWLGRSPRRGWRSPASSTRSLPGTSMGTVESNGASTLVNDFAAMPSLHVGWALWCAAASSATRPARWRHLAWLYPAVTTLVVLGTGNHYLLDAAGGAARAGIGIALTSPAASRATGRSKPERRRRRKAAQPSTTRHRRDLGQVDEQPVQKTPAALAAAGKPSVTSNAVAPPRPRRCPPGSRRPGSAPARRRTRRRPHRGCRGRRRVHAEREQGPLRST